MLLCQSVESFLKLRLRPLPGGAFGGHLRLVLTLQLAELVFVLLDEGGEEVVVRIEHSLPILAGLDEGPSSLVTLFSEVRDGALDLPVGPSHSDVAAPGVSSAR